MITKKIICFVFSFIFSFSLFAIDARVTSLNGKCQIQEKGSSNWVELNKGDIIKEGSIISTGFNSNLVINLGDSVCNVAPLTRLSLEQLSNKVLEGDKNITKTIVYIDTGKASFTVNSTKKNLNDFKVYTPASTASVRGTAFDSYANGEVNVTHGLVGVNIGETRENISKEEFIPDGKEITAFTSTESVGGGSIPVFAGQRILLNGRDVLVVEDPLLQRTNDYYNLVGENYRANEDTMVNAASEKESIPSYTSITIQVNK